MPKIRGLGYSDPKGPTPDFRSLSLKYKSVNGQGSRTTLMKMPFSYIGVPTYECACYDIITTIKLWQRLMSYYINCSTRKHPYLMLLVPNEEASLRTFHNPVFKRAMNDRWRFTYFGPECCAKGRKQTAIQRGGSGIQQISPWISPLSSGRKP